MAFSLWCCSVPMIWNFNDTHSPNGERRSYTYSVCGEAALCLFSPSSRLRPWVHFEAAWLADKVLIPVCIQVPEDARLADFVNRSQFKLRAHIIINVFISS